MTEKEALNVLNDPDSKLTYEEAKGIVAVLKQSATNYADNLSEKILGEYSFYEGEYNALHMTEIILDKIIQN